MTTAKEHDDMKMPEPADHSVICTGAWSVEVTYKNGMVWRTPVAAWSVTKDGTCANPLVLHAQRVCLTTPNSSDDPEVIDVELLLDGKDPWRKIADPSDLGKGVNEDA
jgi:hypothetical protein